MLNKRNLLDELANSMQEQELFNGLDPVFVDSYAAEYDEYIADQMRRWAAGVTSSPTLSSKPLSRKRFGFWRKGHTPFRAARGIPGFRTLTGHYGTS
jgi:hypothetical protein